jgi:hypothetical protein
MRARVHGWGTAPSGPLRLHTRIKIRYAFIEFAQTLTAQKLVIAIQSLIQANGI